MLERSQKKKGFARLREALGYLNRKQTGCRSQTLVAIDNGALT